MARERASQAAAEGDEAKAAYLIRIAEAVDQAPPLGPGQIARLRTLMHPAIASATPKPEHAQAA